MFGGNHSVGGDDLLGASWDYWTKRGNIERRSKETGETFVIDYPLLKVIKCPVNNKNKPLTSQHVTYEQNRVTVFRRARVLRSAAAPRHSSAGVAILTRLLLLNLKSLQPSS